jgi:hypothetical protein
VIDDGPPVDVTIYNDRGISIKSGGHTMHLHPEEAAELARILNRALVLDVMSLLDSPDDESQVGSG